MSNEHSFTTPAPASLGAFALACLGFGAVYLGQVQLGGLPLLAAWLVGGCLIQLVAAVVELKEKNLVSGNVFLYFSGIFMLAAALSVIAKFLMITHGIKPDPTVEGWLWLGGTAFLVGMTPAYAKSNFVLFLIVVCADVVLGMIGFLDLGLLGVTAKPVIGYLCIVCGVLALYLVLAIVTNTMYGKSVFPVPPPLVK
jgi:succinate-acetate transporter protein